MRHFPDRLLIVFAALLIAALACNLDGDGGSKKTTPTFSPVPTLNPLWLTLTPISTPAPTITPLGGALLDASQALPTQTNCTPEATWAYFYTVALGDSLSAIVERMGGNYTIDQIARGNCIANPDQIYVEQVLRLPIFLPAPTPVPPLAATLTPAPTMTPVPDAPVFTQPLTVHQHWISSTGAAVTYLNQVRLDVGETPTANDVEFYVIPPGSTAGQYVGVDSDPYDGAAVDYAFGATGIYTFYAVAHNEKAQSQSTPFTVRYDPTFVPDEGRRNLLTFTPSQYAGGAYRLTAGTDVTVAWPDVPPGNVLYVDFILTPTGTGMGDAGQSIGQDFDLGNGAAITWRVPGGISGHVQAIAHMGGGSASQFSELALVYAE